MAPEKLQKKQKKWMIQLRDSLYRVKESYNLESITLLHRTGGPLESAGQWQSRNEIFGLCATAIYITNHAMDVFLGEIQKFYIDLGAIKVLVIPLHDDNYTILITAATELNNSSFLAMLDETFLPALSKLLIEDLNPFSEKEYLSAYVQDFTDFFTSAAVPTLEIDALKPLEQLDAPSKLSTEVKNFIFDYLEKIPDIKAVSITLNTNSILYWIVLDPAFETLQKSSPSLFALSQQYMSQISSRLVLSLLFECTNYSHLIYRLDEGLFSTIIGQDTEELNQIRSYATKAGQYVKLLAS